MVGETWFVWFLGRRPVLWFDRWLDPGFLHVVLGRFDAELGVWVFYQVTRRGTLIELHSGAEATKALAGLCRASSAVLRWTVRDKPDRFYSRLGFCCVTAAKHILGLSSGALTPRGLYRDLLRAGAVHAFVRGGASDGFRQEDEQRRGGEQQPAQPGADRVRPAAAAGGAASAVAADLADPGPAGH